MVINTKSTSNGKPPDRVNVYLPGNVARRCMRGLSWANEIVPVLLRQQEGKSLATDPIYHIILHNGAPPGGPAGHFDATARDVATDV